MKKDGNDFRKATGLTYGWADGLMQVITRFRVGVENWNSLSRWCSGWLRDRSDQLYSAVLDFKHWYACKGGKYILDTIIKAVAVIAAALAVIIAAVYLWPIVLAALGVGGVTSTVALLSLKGVAAVCGLLSSLIAFSNSLCDYVNTVKAAAIAMTDPGWAARYADISTVTEALRKTYFGSNWDKLSMITANVIDAVDIVCRVVNIVNMVNNAYHFFKGDYRANAVEWKRKFKMWNKDGSFSLKKALTHCKENLKMLKFAFTHDYKATQIAGARKRNYAIYKDIENLRNGKMYKSVMKIFDKLQEGIKKFEKYAY